MSDLQRQELKDERRQRQTREQFEALGRFVQSFEQMVDAVRRGIILVSGISGFQCDLLQIVLHHQVMTAKPLFDVFRAITSVVMNDPKRRIPEVEFNVMQDLLKQVANRYQDACSRRNDLLHGTWYIGWHCADQEDFSELIIDKRKVSAKGLSQAELPASTEALNADRKRCEDIHDILFQFPISLHLIGRNEARQMWPRQLYHQENGLWFSKRSISR